MGQRESKLPPRELKDLFYRTDFSEKEIQEYYKSFKKRYPSGIMTTEDLMRLYNSFFAIGDSTSFAELVFRTFDKNRDEKIDFSEILCALSLSLRGSLDQRLLQSFNMFDQDMDGEITSEDMLVIMKAIYKLIGEDSMERQYTGGRSPEQYVKHLFNIMDKNGDRLVSWNEFTEAAYRDPTFLKLMELCRSGSHLHGVRSEGDAEGLQKVACGLSRMCNIS
ncbi:hippocalcin-like protein 4 [Clavelina lepadiformis]|uniref:hippocalcin-like protein 4 n=1 Tax=Clavelina lepadiformis TaxID=159417 RepID=UPI004042E02E